MSALSAHSPVALMTFWLDTDTEPGTDDEDELPPQEGREPMMVVFKPSTVHVPQATRQRWQAGSPAKQILDALASVGVDYGCGLPSRDLPILLRQRPELGSAHLYRAALFESKESMARYEQKRQKQGLALAAGNAFQQEYSEMVVAAASLLTELQDAITAGDTGCSSDLCAMKGILSGIRSISGSISTLVEVEEDARKGIKHKLRTSGGVAFKGMP